jgi:hypothetical protein
VDFDELLKRQGMYVKHEKVAMERWEKSFPGQSKGGAA